VRKPGCHGLAGFLHVLYSRASTKRIADGVEADRLPGIEHGERIFGRCLHLHIRKN
jgi:hypothetical protein